jgi:hypothetical protein
VAWSGRRTYASKNGDVFEGSFAGGKPDGVGIYRFASDRYEGEMVRASCRAGDAISPRAAIASRRRSWTASPGHRRYHFSNGDRYEGEITGGALSGQGAYYYGSGMKYEGDMRLGQPEGKGTFWFLDGTRFEGAFESGLAKARGEIVRPDGTRTPAEIVDGNAKLLN